MQRCVVLLYTQSDGRSVPRVVQLTDRSATGSPPDFLVGFNNNVDRDTKCNENCQGQIANQHVKQELGKIEAPKTACMSV